MSNPETTAWDGRPVEPKRDGWHWLQVRHGISQPTPRLWWSNIDRWELSDGTLMTAWECAERWRYIGHCLLPGESSECDLERIEYMNRLGRVTEHLGLSMDATASRIIEVVRERVAAEREECAGVSLPMTIPHHVDEWTPAEAFQEGTIHAVAAMRAAIRAREASAA